MNSAFLNSMYQSGLAAGLSDVQARLMAAQAAHESGSGAHAPGNNFFGIKAGGNWDGPTQNLMTSEEVDGRNVRMRQSFRKYDSPEQAIKDRVAFMQRNFPQAFNANDINGAVTGLQHGRFGSYATDSNYAQKLQPYLSAIGAGTAAAPISPAAAQFAANNPQPGGFGSDVNSQLGGMGVGGSIEGSAPKYEPASPFGSMSPMMADNSIDPNVAKYAFADDKNPIGNRLSKAGELFSRATQPPRLRPGPFPGGPSAEQAGGLLKATNNTTQLAQMLLGRRIA